MALPAGTRLGPYEVLAPLGAAGMGEVHGAKDTRLDRTVAIKVLLSPLSASPELRSRLERGAKPITQLSHPHICTRHQAMTIRPLLVGYASRARFPHSDSSSRP